jgi:hypothetical protein
MRTFLQSDPRATFREVFFTCVDAAAVSGVAPIPLQSSDMSTFVVYLTKNNGSNTLLVSPTITQIDATNAKGAFRLDLTAGNIDTPGNGLLIITNTGGTKNMIRREIWFQVDPAFFATAQTGTLTTSAFTSDRTEATDFWKSSMLEGLTGANAGVGGKKIDAFTTTGGIFTLATGITLPATPVNGDIFRITNH